MDLFLGTNYTIHIFNNSAFPLFYLCTLFICGLIYVLEHATIGFFRVFYPNARQALMEKDRFGIETKPSEDEGKNVSRVKGDGEVSLYLTGQKVNRLGPGWSWIDVYKVARMFAKARRTIFNSKRVQVKDDDEKFEVVIQGELESGAGKRGAEGRGGLTGVVNEKFVEPKMYDAHRSGFDYAQKTA